MLDRTSSFNKSSKSSFNINLDQLFAGDIIRTVMFGYLLVLTVGFALMQSEFPSHATAFRFLFGVGGLWAMFCTWGSCKTKDKPWRLILAFLSLGSCLWTQFALGHGDLFTVTIYFTTAVIGGVFLTKEELTLLVTALLVLRFSEIWRTPWFRMFSVGMPDLIGLLSAAWLPKGFVSLYRNIVLEKAFQEKIFQTSATPIITIDRDCIITKVNDEFCTVTGFSRAEIIGYPCDQTLKSDNCDGRCTMVEDNQFDPVYKLQCSINTKDGRCLTILRNGNPLQDRTGRTIGAVVSFVDITEIMEAKAEAEKSRDQAEKLATVDYLTGLLNRRALLSSLDAEIGRANRNKAALGLILTDVDRFKKINDTYGHAAGDLILQEFANTLMGHCRPYDYIGRYGGEEFVICLPETNLDQAVKIADRMRATVEQKSITLPDGSIHLNLSASFGVVSFVPDSEESIDSLISRADKAMYTAKVRRNAVYVG